MHFSTLLVASAAFVSGASIRRDKSGTVSVTPHDQYSSSVGVLGCKINTNRVAYWPGTVDCNNICVNVSHGDRSVHLLKIDSSAGAHDISYDAWNYLSTGKGATKDPQMGGGIDMDYKFVDASKCKDLLGDDGKLPLSAANSMNYVASCLSEPKSWVARNHRLFNILDPVCKYGVDEECKLDMAVSNQPACPSVLGLNTVLDGHHVKNIAYGTGKEEVAQ